MNMILDFAVNNKIEEKYLPKKLWIFTDMQFDKSENASHFIVDITPNRPVKLIRLGIHIIFIDKTSIQKSGI